MTSLDTPATEARESTARDDYAYVIPALAVLQRASELRQEWNPCSDLLPWESLTEAQKAPWIGRAWAQREGWRPPAAVIPADTRPYETQTAALKALPVHTLVSYRDHDGELHTLEKDTNFAGHVLWFKPGERRGDDTYNLVRNEVDYTIVRMGDGS